MHSLLVDIALAVIAATALGMLVHWLRQPIILGYLLAGVLIGPHFTKGWIRDPQSIQTISELGLILLLFIIGLEMDLKKVLASGRQLLIAGFGQFPLCAVMGLALFGAAGFGLSGKHSDGLYLGLLCGLSSTAIVVKLLYDKGELDTLAGRLSVGILVIQDIYAILILAFQPNLANPSLRPIIRSLLCAGALLGVGFLASRFLLARVFQSIRQAPEMVVAVSIAWCAAIAFIAQQWGLSMEMGALVAGLSISAFPYSVHVTAKTLPLRDFFLTLFFVSLGMLVTVPTSQIILPVLAVVVFVAVSRFLSVYPLLRLAGSGPRTAFVSSLNLAQISEFSLVIAVLGTQLGHISQQTVQIFVYAMAITAVVSSYTVRYNHQLYGLLHRIARGAAPLQPESRPTPSGRQIVILGCHRAAQILLHLLERHHPALLSQVLVVDFNQETIDQLNARGISALFGDISSLSTLEHAHVNDAKAVLCTIPDMLLRGTSNAGVARICRALAPGARIVVTADDESHERKLLAEGADAVILPYELTGQRAMELLQQIVERQLATERGAQPAGTALCESQISGSSGAV